MGTHPIFESDFDCLTDLLSTGNSKVIYGMTAPFGRLLQPLREKSKYEGQSWSERFQELYDDFWSDENRELRLLLLQFCLQLGIIYISHKLTIAIMSQLRGKTKTSPIKMLKSMGFTNLQIKRLLPKLTEHELHVLCTCGCNTSNFEDTMSSIAGLEKAKGIIENHLRLVLKYRTAHNLVQVTPGVLLHGPPGCGKTMLARAIAKESGFRFLLVKPSVVNDKYLGESEKFIQGLFSLAAKIAPCILFVDEIEVLLGNRLDDNLNNIFKQTKIAEFLTAMDGFEKVTQPVLVIGATNLKDKLDNAILRRLPTKIEIPLPSSTARLQMFEMEFAREGLEVENELWKGFVNRTEKWDCSKIKNFIQCVISEAAIETIQQKDEESPPLSECEEESTSLVKSNFSPINIGIGILAALGMFVEIVRPSKARPVVITAAYTAFVFALLQSRPMYKNRRIIDEQVPKIEVLPLKERHFEKAYDIF